MKKPSAIIKKELDAIFNEQQMTHILSNLYTYIAQIFSLTLRENASNLIIDEMAKSIKETTNKMRNERNERINNE